MTNLDNGVISRRESLQKSVDSSARGGVTLSGSKLIASAPGCKPAQCTIVGYCRTFLFEFPRAKLLESFDCQIVYSDDEVRATIVSDLTNYFRHERNNSRHYTIDVSLRAGVRSTHVKSLEQAERRAGSSFPLFLVVEEDRKVPPAVLNRGECFSMDEYRNGEELIAGGRAGERALVAVKTIDGSWPEFTSVMNFVNIVLASVKVEQVVTDPIRELHRCSCYVDDKNRAIYPIIPTMSARASTIIEFYEADIHRKAEKIETMLRAMLREASPILQELFDSIVLDRTEDDSYLRLWYLRLWQAVDDAKRHLGYPQLWNTDATIAGRMTPRKLNDYRNKIAHWHTGTMDFQYLNELQCTAMELLRRKYGSD